MLTKSWKKALVQENRAKEVKQSSWFRDSKKIETMKSLMSMW